MSGEAGAPDNGSMVNCAAPSLAATGGTNLSNVSKRICFLLQVRPERIAEYKERHKAVWPEMCRALRETGWENYSLFLRPDGLLVGYLETSDFEKARQGMAAREVNGRWQNEMAPFFMNTPGIAPDQAMTPLEEIFHLD